MKKVSQLLQNNPAVSAIASGHGQIIVNDSEGEAYLIASAFLRCRRTILIVKDTQYQAAALYRALTELLPDVVQFAADETLRVDAVAYSFEMLGERINTLYKLTQGEPVICVTSVPALSRHITGPGLFKSSVLTLQRGDIIDPKELVARLSRMGYRTIARIDAPFYMSRRGGVVDVYSIQYDQPIRIEFFDDEIDTMAFFDRDTQRRGREITEAVILPATDMMYDPEETASVENVVRTGATGEGLAEESRQSLLNNIGMDLDALETMDYSPRMYQYLNLYHSTGRLTDYLPDGMIIVDKERDCQDAWKRFVTETDQYARDMREIGEMWNGADLYQDVPNMMAMASVHFTAFRMKKTDLIFNTHPVDICRVNEAPFVHQLQEYENMGRVLIALANRDQISALTRTLEDANISYANITMEETVYPGINIYLGTLPKGVEFTDEHVVVLTHHELFRVTKERRRYVRYDNAHVIRDYNELSRGDYVVHDKYGIGRYMGIETMEFNGVKKDYLHIAYKGNDIVRVPVENFQLIRKYASADGRAPKIHSTSSSQWAREKARVRAKVDGLADELIALYAARMSQKGFAFNADDEIQEDFETQFGYSLTPDQERSVREMKQDMESERPMDRLLCGDVGFGKTEVALRGCMKAVLSGKQAAFLCPTTILSSQHYRTMKERFKNFPVNIALFNRFTSAKEKNQLLKELKEGNIDILIGTHRLLSKDVEFKDLGLLCIDEEQRFGVRQKEKIKDMRKTIDVLTLTATPIPRTLQMSLMGVRELSQIETPPLNRMPVQTYVCEESVPLIRQVIERELARKGQVFYLHNRTESIAATAAKIRRLVPSARIGIGHGQMKKQEIEDVMQAFVDGEYDILVCTTIIETGIDIPNANTIIVEDADRFGLAQLYQIKGRVGRSDRLAYAYLLYRQDKSLSEDAQKRLKAIKDFTRLGSGYKIAQRDLSIRGAGDILGSEQAGFIDTVGYDMYMRILQDAIKEKQGQKVPQEEEDVPVSQVKIDGYIPKGYVESDAEKLRLYQEIFKANTMDDLAKVEGELRDLYGHLPHEVMNILTKRHFDILTHDKRVSGVLEADQEMAVYFTGAFSDTIDGIRFFENACRCFRKPRLLNEKGQLGVSVTEGGGGVEAFVLFLDDLFGYKQLDPHHRPA